MSRRCIQGQLAVGWGACGCSRDGQGPTTGRGSGSRYRKSKLCSPALRRRPRNHQSFDRTPLQRCEEWSALASSLDSISLFRFSSKLPKYPVKVSKLNFSPTPVSSGSSLSARRAAASLCRDWAHSQCCWHASSDVCPLNTTMYWLGMASVDISGTARIFFFFEGMRGENLASDLVSDLVSGILGSRPLRRMVREKVAAKERKGGYIHNWNTTSRPLRGSIGIHFPQC